MKTLSKRILSMALVFFLCLAMLPVVAMQAEAATPGYAVSSSYKASSYYSALCNVTLTGNQREDIVNVALSQVGYREGSSANDYGGADDGSYNNYTEYNYWYHNYVSSGMPVGGDSAPWCATFVSWCAEQANIPSSILKRSTAAGHGASYFNVNFYSGSSTLASSSDNDSYFKGYNYTPQKGDLFFTRSWSHVGLVVGVSGNYVITVEGNTNNNGSSQGNGVYKLTWRKIADLYFGVPNYTNSSINHTVDSSYGTNFTAYPKAKITAENIFNEYHTQIDSTSWIGTSDKCTIHEVYTDGCCKVTYPLDAGGTKTVFSKISLFVTPPEVPTVSIPESYYIAGESVTVSWNAVANNSFYQINVYKDGELIVDQSMGNSTSYTLQSPSAGNYRIALSANNSAGQAGIASCSFTVLSAPNVFFDADVYYAVSPDLAELYGEDERALYIHWVTRGCGEGRIASLLFDARWYLAQNEDVAKELGTENYWGAYNHFVTTGINEGRQGSIFYDPNFYVNRYEDLVVAYGENFPSAASHFVDCGINEERVASPDFSVGIYAQKNPDVAEMYPNIKDRFIHYLQNVLYGDDNRLALPAVYYNANGGTGAPDRQIKRISETVILDSGKPTRDGYAFQGWATSADGSAQYQPGDSYSEDQDLKLYAVWKVDCSDNHSYCYEVTKEPTTTASGTLTGTCSKCGATTSVTLPKLNTTDYTYSVSTPATCTETGSGRYAWKTTTYGSFYFDVSIPATGHTYTDEVTAPTCTEQGYTTHTCSCGYSYKDAYTGATGHNYSNGSCTHCGAEEPVSSYDACVYTEAKKSAVRGSQFTYTVSLAGTYDGFSFEIASGNDLTVTDIITTNSDINIDKIGDKWMVSVLGGLAKTDAEKEELVTVTVQVASDAELGARTLTLSNFMLSSESGDKVSAIKYEYASIEITDQIPGDINGDGTFDYYDVSKLYAYYRNKTTLSESVDTDVNGDGGFDYYDVSKLYAIYRGKANFN